MEDDGADERRAGNGENPGPDDAARNTPANGSEAAGRSYADDGAGNGVSGADGDAKNSIHDESEAAGGFGSESAKGS